MVRNLARVALVLTFVCTCALSQTPAYFVRDYCIKVAPGKQAEFNNYVRDVSGKLLQAHVDTGDVAFAMLAQSVEPAGTTARCDYRAVYGYNGSIPEPFSAEQVDAALKRADLKMDAAGLSAMRNSMSRLVSVDIMRRVDSVPYTLQKGGYVRVNHYKTKPGKIGAWRELESSVWKPLVNEYVKQGGVTGWSAWVVMMPSGSDVYSNAMTVDSFPNWDSLVKGIGAGQLWSKVHPNRSIAAWSDQSAAIVDRPLVEVLKVVEVALPKRSTSGGR